MNNLEKPQKQESNLLEDLDISIRLYQFLKNLVKIKSLNELTRKTESEVSSLCEIEGQSYLKELKKILSDKNLSFKIEEIWRGTEFWTDEIEKAGVKDKLRFFNDVVVEKRPPHPESGYKAPVLIDVILDGKKCDVYHSDHDEEDTWHRLFIYTKE